MVLTVVEIDASGNTVKLDPAHNGGGSDAAFHDAYLAGAAYSCGTGLVPLSHSDIVNVFFCNPAGSGKVVHVTRRFFAFNGISGRPLRVGFAPEPASFDGLTAVSNSALLSGGPAAVARMYVMTDGASIGASPFGFWVQKGGVPYDIDTPRALMPGECFGFTMIGDSGLTDDAVDIAHVWYEVDE